MVDLQWEANPHRAWVASLYVPAPQDSPYSLLDIFLPTEQYQLLRIGDTWGLFVVVSQMRPVKYRETARGDDVDLRPRLGCRLRLRDQSLTDHPCETKDDIGSL